MSERELLRAIHKNCLECSGGIKTELERCKCKTCPLWKYRLGEIKDGRAIRKSKSK